MKLLLILLFLFSFCSDVKSEDKYLTSLKFNSLEKENSKNFVIQKRYFSKTVSFNKCIKEMLIEAIESSKYVNEISSDLPIAKKYKKEAISYINGFDELNVSTCAFSSIINDKFPGHYTFSNSLKTENKEAIMVKKILKNSSKTVFPKIIIHFLFPTLQQELLNKCIDAYTYDEDFFRSIDPKNTLSNFKEKFRTENEGISKKFGESFNKEFEEIYNSNDPYKPSPEINVTLKKWMDFSVEYSKKLVSCGYNEEVEKIIEKIKDNREKLTGLEFSSNRYEYKNKEILSGKDFDKEAIKINEEYERIGTFFDSIVSFPVPSENEEAFLNEFKNILQDYKYFKKYFSPYEFEKLRKLKNTQKLLFLIYASSYSHKGPIMRRLGWTLVTVGVVASIASCRYAWGTPALPSALALSVASAVFGGVFLAWDYALDGGGF